MTRLIVDTHDTAAFAPVEAMAGEHFDRLVQLPHHRRACSAAIVQLAV